MRLHRTLNLSIRQSSSIVALERFETAALAENSWEHKINNFDRDNVEQVTELAANKAYLNQNLDSLDEDTLSSIFSSNSNNSSFDSEISKAGSRNKSPRHPRSICFQKNSWITSGTTAHAKNKLVRILKGKSLVLKQCWGLEKILAMLTYHRNNLQLKLSYRQFKRFAYQTLLEKSDKDSGQLPNALA